MVAKRHQSPEDVDGEEGDGERYEAHRLQPAPHVEVVLSSPKAQPARDRCQRRDEEEAHHVAEQRPLFVAWPGVLQPLCERPRPPLDAELCVTELTVAGVGGRQPLLQAAPMHRAQRARAVTWRQQTLAAASLVANAADGTVALYAHGFEHRGQQAPI